MAARFWAKFIITLIFLIASSSCGLAADEHTQYTPRQLSVDATVASAKELPLAIYNPSSKAQRFQIKTSSPRVFVDPSRLSVQPKTRELLQVRLICPREAAEFEEEITIIKTDDTTYKIPIDLRCHLSPEDGAATLTVDILGLPPGEQGRVEIQGPSVTSLLLTSSETIAELPMGDYRLRAEPVEAESLNFLPLIVEQEFSLDDGDELHLTVEYVLPTTAAPGSLYLTSRGLPDDTPVEYQIRGPRAYRASFELPTSFKDLSPGGYILELPDQIRADSPKGRHLFRPRQNPFHLFIPPGHDVEVTVLFEDSRLVSASQDGAPGSLRNIIEEAPAHSVITISDDFDEIRLTEGPIIIKTPLTIRGTEGAAPITTAGRQGTFKIEEDTSLHLENLTFIDAAGLGQPVIENDGKLSLSNIHINECEDYLGPPALLSRARLIIDGLHLEENISERGPGALHVESGTAHITGLKALSNKAVHGGALFLEAKTTIADSYFASNQAEEGGAIKSTAHLELKDSTFFSNQATRQRSTGGALYIQGDGRITNSTFLNNLASKGSQIALHSGRLEIAHLTLVDDTEEDHNHLFVDSESHFISRNTLFSDLQSGAPSLEADPGATLESRGGNYLPAAPEGWPTRTSAPRDLVHNTEAEASLLMPPIEIDGMPTAIPLKKEHPGRLHIPGPYCRNARATALATDQLKNPRNIDFFCDIGAHQSRTEVLIETFSTTDPDPLAKGILTTQAGLSWTIDDVLVPDIGPVTILSEGSLRASFDQPICRLAIIARAEQDASPTPELAATAQTHQDQQTPRQRQFVSNHDWRSLGFHFPNASSTLEISALNGPIELTALLWSEVACPLSLDTP